MDPSPQEGIYLLRRPFPLPINRISSFDISLITTHLLPMTNSTPPKQLKQRYYYIFWSIATIAVVFGQIYVAISYRGLADALRASLLPS